MRRANAHHGRSQRMRIDSLSVSLARRLQQLRLKAGISLTRLAKKVRLSAPALQHIEDGRTKPSLGTLSDLANQLGTSVTELVREAREGTGAATTSDTAMGTAQIGRAIVELPDGGDKLDIAAACILRTSMPANPPSPTDVDAVLGALDVADTDME
jgi:transcriptional regulator with XRE-family HTH domain